MILDIKRYELRIRAPYYWEQSVNPVQWYERHYIGNDVYFWL